ncbi:MAG: hypothetical protein GXP62_08650 [Oligoflexia bacterium]|nr:hypothetical protein [Oligoflexia bacterium]
MLPLQFIPALLLGCTRNSVSLGAFAVDASPATGGLTVSRDGVELLDLRQIALGAGSADISFSVGSYKFDNVQATWDPAAGLKIQQRQDEILLLAELRDDSGRALASLRAWPAGEDLLGLRIEPYAGTLVDGQAVNRIRARIGCTEGGAFLGTGGQELDVDHQGEAYSLWVSEPGIGKVDTDVPPDDWFITGTRHATSFPQPFLLRPDLPVGLVAATYGRVDLDLCATDPDVYDIAVWDSTMDLYIVGGDTALSVVEHQAMAAGGVVVPPDAAFGPWNDAVEGVDRVMEVANTLRKAGAPTALLWTEDWKGAEKTAFGYQLSLGWTLDKNLYPDAEGIAKDLAALGFQWLAYFSPFVGEDTTAYDEAQDLLIKTADGDPYLWPSATLQNTGALDLSDPAAQEWAQDRMTDLLDIGFAGWMADYGEWVPPDGVLANADPIDNHNAYPLWWQATNRDLLSDLDATWFSRSGWISSPAMSPVTWGGDQRTSFDADDGFPTVIPLGIGLGIGGVSFFGSDIGGYSSIGNDPSTKELWFRWAWLGAFSPIMRTHHGALADQNVQFDTDKDTLAHWVTTSTEHSLLFPYLRGLAALSESQGRPMVLHPGLVYPGYDWARIDAWLLGSALFVAPVTEEGATGRDIELPPGDWYDWWTGQPATSGWTDADIDQISVFAASGTIVPLFAQAPETFVSGTDLRDLTDVDGARLLRVFGSDGSFTEADGTTYQVSGTATTSGSETDTLASGSISVSGLTVTITGDVTRSYTVQVWP